MQFAKDCLKGMADCAYRQIQREGKKEDTDSEREREREV
jgi:hypothetical protein